jgi:hypothetical protein
MDDTQPEEQLTPEERKKENGKKEKKTNRNTTKGVRNLRNGQ